MYAHHPEFLLLYHVHVLSQIESLDPEGVRCEVDVRRLEDKDLIYPCTRPVKELDQKIIYPLPGGPSPVVLILILDEFEYACNLIVSERINVQLLSG